MIGVLAAAGSQSPTAIIAPGLIVATFIGTVSAIIAAKLLQPFYPAPAAALPETTE
jgi:spore maturation protein SpmA